MMDGGLHEKHRVLCCSELRLKKMAHRNGVVRIALMAGVCVDRIDGQIQMHILKGREEGDHFDI